MSDYRHPESVFPESLFTCSSLFTRSTALHFRQGAWLDQTDFVKALERSWIAQYREYLDNETAHRLVQQMINDGSIYEHDEQATIQAWSANTIVGIAALRKLDGMALITMLEVHEDCQGQGIGTALLKALETASSRLLAHVSIHRPYLKPFYSRCGYTELQPAVVDHHGHQLTFDIMVRSC